MTKLIAAFQKGLALKCFSRFFGIWTRACASAQGRCCRAREHLARFQKITTEHLGAPFGAGYGDQGRYSLAELPLNSNVEVPAPIPVRFVEQPDALVSKSAGANGVDIGPSTGACFFDYDGDGKPDLFLVSGAADGASRLLHNLGDGRFEEPLGCTDDTRRGRSRPEQHEYPSRRSQVRAPSSARRAPTVSEGKATTTRPLVPGDTFGVGTNVADFMPQL